MRSSNIDSVSSWMGLSKNITLARSYDAKTQSKNVQSCCVLSTAANSNVRLSLSRQMKNLRSLQMQDELFFISEKCAYIVCLPHLPLPLQALVFTLPVVSFSSSSCSLLRLQVSISDWLYVCQVSPTSCCAYECFKQCCHPN